jgi:hypothetical protein
MPATLISRAADPRDLDRLRAEARRLARDIAVRNPQALALACAKAGGDAGAGLAWAWIDMVRDEEVHLLATPLDELIALLDVRPQDDRGPLRRRLARLAELLEELADAEFGAGFDAADIAQEAA